jgi:hypothetical protein
MLPAGPVTRILKAYGKLLAGRSFLCDLRVVGLGPVERFLRRGQAVPGDVGGLKR